MKKYVIVFVCLGLVPIIWAGPVTVNITDPTLNAAGAGQIITDKINSEFQVPEMGSFLKAMSNAQSLANKGQGVSYATEHSLFVVGGGFGLGTSNGTGSVNANGGLPPFGIGIQASGMVGVSLAKFPLPQLGPVDPKRITLFINFFTYSNDTLVSSLTVKANTFGIHAQYKLIDSKNVGGIGILNWGGLAFTTGFDVSSNSLKYKIGQSISTDISGSRVVWTPNSSSSLDLDASVFTIPLEISTNVRILYILSIFAGAGIDLNMGKSSISANLNGVISSTGAVNNSNAGSASLNINENQGPTFGHLRFFAGPQINLVPLKNTNLLSLYAQGNVSTGGNYGVHAGARIAW
jgi:hypothetical protein